MSNLFNGLESMGLQGLENVKIYDDEPKKTDNKAEKTKTPEVTEADYLFDKTYKFYFYEQGSNKLIMSTSLDKGEKVTVHVLNLSTSKGYYFKIVPNNQTNISGKVYR